MSIKETIVEKASVANIVSAIVIISSIAYAFWTRDKDIMLFTVGAAVGYLLKLKTE